MAVMASCGSTARGNSSIFSLTRHDKHAQCHEVVQKGLVYCPIGYWGHSRLFNGGGSWLHLKVCCVTSRHLPSACMHASALCCFFQSTCTTQKQKHITPAFTGHPKNLRHQTQGGTRAADKNRKGTWDWESYIIQQTVIKVKLKGLEATEAAAEGDTDRNSDMKRGNGTKR